MLDHVANELICVVLGQMLCNLERDGEVEAPPEVERFVEARRHEAVVWNEQRISRNPVAVDTDVVLDAREANASSHTPTPQPKSTTFRGSTRSMTRGTIDWAELLVRSRPQLKNFGV